MVFLWVALCSKAKYGRTGIYQYGQELITTDEAKIWSTRPQNFAFRSGFSAGFSPIARFPLLFVDVETTGGSPRDSGVTEVGIVVVQWPDDGTGPPLVQRWVSLINPGTPIPPEISYLTNITNEMVVNAPTFEQVIEEIKPLLADAIFVAHHARFDYGFIRAEFARCGEKFSAQTLCTVRLSRALHPDRSPHTLDALIIRHQLACPDRHRALGDAQVLWAFLNRMFVDHGSDRVNEACAKLLKRPSLPSHLGIESVQSIPARPGVYVFHGLNAHPLYIGKSSNIRQRIGSHFTNDHQSERGVRLASETRRISWQETPGEFSALLTEIKTIREQTPSHNQALRRNQQAIGMRFEPNNPKPEFVRLAPLPDANAKRSTMPFCENPGSGEIFGPFSSRAAARTQLQHLAQRLHWCQNSLGLTRGDPGTPCFAYQLGRCAGACVGEISGNELHDAVTEELDTLRIPRWPNARLLVIEKGFGLTQWHLFERWCWLGGGEGEPTDEQLELSSIAPFDRHLYSLIRQHFGDLPDENNARWHKAASKRRHRTQSLRAMWLPIDAGYGETPVQEAA